RRRAPSPSTTTTTTTGMISPASRNRRPSRNARWARGADVGEPFLMRALLAGLGLAVVAAPLGCFVLWRRMAYYGEAVAQAGLIRIPLGLAPSLNLNGTLLVVPLLPP